MTAIYPYLTFENAKEAMAYYEQDFGAQITYHEALTKSRRKVLDYQLINWTRQQCVVNL